jgi:hypothetical protein
VAPDKAAAIDRAMEEFRIEPARRFRLIAEPVVDPSAVGSIADGDTAGCETDTPDLRSPRAIGGCPDQP